MPEDPIIHFSFGTKLDTEYGTRTGFYTWFRVENRDWSHWHPNKLEREKKREKEEKTLDSFKNKFTWF